ncbi:MAG: DUF3617 family protein [Porticoccaceae bacterium]
MSRRIFAFCSLVLLVSGAANAATLKIQPGLWEAVWTSTNPLTGEAITDRRTQCVRTEDFNPRQLLKQTQGCEVVKEALNGNKLNFSLLCGVEGGPKTRVDGDFQTSGRAGDGHVRTNMSFGSMAVQMDTKVATRRVGDC